LISLLANIHGSIEPPDCVEIMVRKAVDQCPSIEEAMGVRRVREVDLVIVGFYDQ
jgi:hypothetical protein